MVPTRDPLTPLVAALPTTTVIPAEAGFHGKAPLALSWLNANH